MRSPALTAGLAALLLGAASVHSSAAERVELVDRSDRRGGRATLLVDGQPFVIRGAGGDGSLEALARAGGNSVRTWGVGPETKALMDRAHALGLMVTVGIWLGHARHGFDYHDPIMVADQLARVRAEVVALADHPALLAWGVGNEMEGFERGDDPAVWKAVNDVAAMIKELDPDHPTMTVTAEIGGERVAMINRHCPAIDIHGINSYGGLPTLAERYRAAGGVKPWVVTELGPPGSWEAGKSAWGAALELTSSEKAELYRQGYERLVPETRARCLGGFVFAWGHKREATATWFGMFLPDGDKLGAVDAMTVAWTGRAPANRCPVISPIVLGGPASVAPGGRVAARVTASDPDGDPVTLRWVLESEAATYALGGDAEVAPRDWPEAIADASGDHTIVELPQGGGGYRLYAYARDGRGGAAVANVPLAVDGPPLPPPPIRPALPLSVFGEDAQPSFAASGWMGDRSAIVMDPADTERPAYGRTSLRVDFKTAGGWGGVVWQSPANDWGDAPGGFDLRGARLLTFWARGAKGGERVKFLMGLIGPDRPFPDSARTELAVTLGFRWQRYFIDLRGLDLSRIKTGFGWIVAGEAEPITFYLDDIGYE